MLTIWAIIVSVLSFAIFTIYLLVKVLCYLYSLWCFTVLKHSKGWPSKQKTENGIAFEPSLEIVAMNDQQNPKQDNQPFETDAEKIVRKHMEDPNHQISEEEFASVRIGMTPPPDAPTEEAIEKAEDNEKVADRKTINEDDIVPGAEKATPWDTIK